MYRATEDKDGLESIRALHRQLDDDNDGSIEPSETGDFIRGDLKKVKNTRIAKLISGFIIHSPYVGQNLL